MFRHRGGHARARLVLGSLTAVLMEVLVACTGFILQPLLRHCKSSILILHYLQVWNRNPCSGIVAAMHVQGSSWDRRRRQFYEHDPHPPPLSCDIRPCDVPQWQHMVPEDMPPARQLPGTFLALRCIRHTMLKCDNVHRVSAAGGRTICPSGSMWSVENLLSGACLSIMPLAS